MTAAIIPFTPSQGSGSKLAGAGANAMNVMTDSAGALIRRPALATYVLAEDLDGTEVNGLFAAEDGMLLAFTKGGMLYAIIDGSATLVGGFVATRRPVVIETESMYVFAAGAQVMCVNKSTLSLEAIAPESPVASYVAYNKLRVLANDLVQEKTRIRYSGVASGTETAGHRNWSFGGLTQDGGFMAADTSPDPVVGLMTLNEDVLAFGSKTIDAFSFDEGRIFSLVGTRGYGCIAPYTLCKVDQSIVWLDDRRRVIATDGRTFESVSDDIESELLLLDYPGEAWGGWVKGSNANAYLLTFPAEGRTFCRSGEGWSQWQAWDDGEWFSLGLASLSYDAITARTFVGMEDGSICYLDHESNADRGVPIHAFVETGFVSHGTSARKLCSGVSVVIERSHSSASTQEAGHIQWADRSDAWRVPYPVGFGSATDRRNVVSLGGLGSYRNRAWRFSFTGTGRFALVAAEETFQVMENE